MIIDDEVAALPTLRDRIVARLDETQNLILATQFRDELIVQLVERHGPMTDDFLDVFSVVCSACSDPGERQWTTYPCAELRMIATALGVGLTD